MEGGPAGLIRSREGADLQIICQIDLLERIVGPHQLLGKGARLALWSELGRGIPPFHYMVAKAGGSRIECAAYATYGTQALSDNVLAALGGRRACLMANHGMVALGPDPAAALALAIEVETLAAQYLRALTLGEPALLSEDEMLRVLEKFETYGAQPGRDPGAGDER